jgi:hypothetical protein
VRNDNPSVDKRASATGPDGLSVVMTRWRDISFEEMLSNFNEDFRRTAVRGYWEKLRGKPVMLRVPPVDWATIWGFTCCKGPFYAVLGIGKNGDGSDIVACSHIVEIGD